MKPNIGTLDRWLRLTAGLMIYGSGLAQQRHSLSRYALLSLGSMKVAEGITGWCPLLELTGGSTLDTIVQKAATKTQSQQPRHPGSADTEKSASEAQRHTENRDHEHRSSTQTTTEEAKPAVEFSRDDGDIDTDFVLN